jgi:hypothetical protein
MNKDTLFVLAQKSGMGYIQYLNEAQVKKVEAFAALARNQTLEEVAQEFDSLRIAFGDTAASFAQYVREMKSAQT